MAGRSKDAARFAELARLLEKVQESSEPFDWTVGQWTMLAQLRRRAQEQLRAATRGPARAARAKAPRR